MARGLLQRNAANKEAITINSATLKHKHCFKQFDNATNYSDHHFASSFPFYEAGSDVHRNIMRELKTLENNLPESIYVRVYEERIDLLRAMIIGPLGTPYHDALFFFDFLLPPDYPNLPPLVHYKSYGLPLNSNLFTDGNVVCLSLLNTHSPSGSVILEALASLRALLFRKTKFFETTGHASFGTYREEAFLLSCRTMVCVLENPPKGFESVVAEHFRDRGQAILMACQAYSNGLMRVGRFQNDGSSQSKQVQVPEGFKRSMQYGVYPDLEKALTRNDQWLGGFIQILRTEWKIICLNPKLVEKGNVDEVPKEFLKRKGGVIERVVGMVKKCLGRN